MASDHSQNIALLESDHIADVIDDLSPHSRLLLRTAARFMRTILGRLPGIWDEMLNQRGRFLIQRSPFMGWFSCAERTRQANRQAMQHRRMRHLRILFESLQPARPRPAPPIWLRGVFREFSRRSREAKLKRACFRCVRKRVLHRNDTLRSILGRPTNAMIKRECMRTLRAHCLQRRFLKNIRSSITMRQHASSSQEGSMD